VRPAARRQAKRLHKAVGRRRITRNEKAELNRAWLAAVESQPWVAADETAQFQVVMRLAARIVTARVVAHHAKFFDRKLHRREKRRARYTRNKHTRPRKR